MTGEPPACTFCGDRIPGEPLTDTGGATYCSAGCRDVDTALPALDASHAEAASPREDETGGRESDRAGARDAEVFFQVDGMHSVSCERFLEARASNVPGVSAADASYITETVRISYDPDRCSVDELQSTLDVLGYVPRSREDAETSGARRTQRGSPGQRSVDEILGFRYVAGVVFASFLMLPYVVLFYPAHLAAMTGGRFLGYSSEMAAVSGANLMLVLPLFMGMTAIIVLFTGAPLLRGAYVALWLRQPNTDLLVTITLLSGYVLSTILAVRGLPGLYFDLVIVVAAGVVAASFYETDAKRRALSLLTDLTISTVEEVRLLAPDGETTMVDRDQIPPDSRVLVQEGERVPVDGVLVDGSCTVDEAIVTGEGRPVLKSTGDALLGGSVVTSGWAALDVHGDAENSRDRLRAAVWSLQSATHGVHRHANRLATIATPVVVGLGLLGTLFGLATGATLLEAASLGLVVLVASSPWALGLSTPLSVAAGIEAAMKRGIVVFDETMFERLRDVDVVVFDKTGTLTTGEMTVRDVDAPPDLLAAAGRLEQRTSHPIADAIASAFGPGGTATDDHPEAAWGGVDGAAGGPEVDVGDTEDDAGAVESFTSHALGVEGRIDGEQVVVGHPRLFADKGWSIPESIRTQIETDRSEGRVSVLVGREGAADGIISVGDEPRANWAETVSRLQAEGLDVVVLTGDDGPSSTTFGEHPGVSRVFAGVSPPGKTTTIERLQQRGRVAMVGDGTNDAPALTQADLGIVLGSGAALAAEAADVGLAEDDLSSIDAVFDLAHAVKRRVRQNNLLAFTYNALSLPLVVLGMLNPLLVLAAVLLTGGLVAVNSFRPLLNA